MLGQPIDQSLRGGEIREVPTVDVLDPADQAAFGRSSILVQPDDVTASGRKDRKVVQYHGIECLDPGDPSRPGTVSFWY